MAPPQSLTYGLAAASATVVVNASNTVAALTNFVLNSTVLDTQRRLLFTFSGDEHLNTFKVTGLNLNNATISETVNGTNGTTAQTVLDYKTINVIEAIGSTAATVSVGTDGVGSSLWQIVNWNATPVNIGFGCSIQAGSANFTLQYTYDDPNNLPSAVATAQAFNHPTIAATTANTDGAINDPITAWRLLVNSGTGTVRAVGIQAGLGSP